jgi:hypothetical protein
MNMPTLNKRPARRARVSGGWLAIVLMLALPAMARADLCPVADAAELPADYMATIKEAVTEHAEGHFVEARAQFLRAHQLHPSARTLRGLGMVEFELRNYGESVRYLQAALGCQVRPLDAELAEETEQLLARARAYVGEVHVALSPEAATILVDGVTVARGPEAALVLIVGDHVLEFRASGLRPERRTVQVRSGERTTLEVRLESAEPAGPRVSLTLPSRAEAPREPAEPQRLVRKWWLWTGVAVVVAGALTGSLLATRGEPDERAPSTTDHVPPGISLSALRGQP